MNTIENRETELRAFEVDGDNLREVLTSLGALSVGHYDFKRAVLDVIPATPNKWIRVRTDGNDTTLAVKERISDEFDGTGESEVATGDFEGTLVVLHSLGYRPRSIQETRRDSYHLNGIEISIDSWPKIKDLIELEGDDEAMIRRTAQQLGLADHQLTTESVESYYQRTLDLDVRKIPTLTFDN